MKPEMSRVPGGDVVIYDDRDETCRHQAGCLRKWGLPERLILIPASDPRTLVWFGTSEESVPRGTFTYLGVDGTRICGEEAILRLLDALPSGKGRMFAVMLGERSAGQGDPSQALWQSDGCISPEQGRKRRSAEFDGRGRLRCNDQMGH